jgi:hypothetical protein
MERFQNGTYKVMFRIYDATGKYEQQVEVGEWGISGAIYFSIMKGVIKDSVLLRADPTKAYHYDAYKIIKLDQNEMEYEHAESGDKFKLKKVPTDFMFSD